MRMLIVVGDRHSGGGSVITGSPHTDIDGLAVARVGDKATCPAHKGIFPIITGDETLIIDGNPVARHGDRLACGCSLLSGRQPHKLSTSRRRCPRQSSSGTLWSQKHLRGRAQISHPLSSVSTRRTSRGL